MAHSLVPIPTISPSPNLRNKNNAGIIAATQPNNASPHFRRKRGFIYSLIASGLASFVAVESANAARRPPPPPPEEKKDPSISGVRAKVLASIKRKEAMKEEIAKLRGKGKPVN